MRVNWTNLITLWLSQLVGCEFLMFMGYGQMSASIVSGIVVGLSFGLCDVRILEETKKP